MQSNAVAGGVGVCCLLISGHNLQLRAGLVVALVTHPLHDEY